ncbi:MAG: iron ABC transporter permease [Pirellulaceae bacterium]|nr:iron ABC transporter permease [Pirellulaceae bacterium]
MKSLWPVVCLLIAAIVAGPLVEILLNLGRSSDGMWQHLADTVLVGYVCNTVWLAIGVSIGTLLIGVSTAWVVTMCRFPGQSILRWALLLPLAIPTYLLAYATTDLLQFSGPIQSTLRDMFGWTSAQDYWFPDVRSLPGATCILTLGFYPYVYLAARAGFIEQSMCALEASRTLGAGPWRSFYGVALPLARPSIVAGLSLVLMETFAEFGAVDFCAVDTFATGIYRTWASLGSLVAAAQLSACLLGVVVLLLIVESKARGRAKFYHATTRYRELKPWQLHGSRAAIAMLVCSAPVVLGFLIPASVFIWMSIHHGDRRGHELIVELGTNSVLLASIAAGVATCLSLVVGYARRVHPTRVVCAATGVTGVGYAVPGGVIAIGVMSCAWWLEDGINNFTEQRFDWSPGLFISGTIMAMLLGYQTRFLAVSLGLIRTGLARIRPSMDEAARTLGASSGRILIQVHTPMIRSSVMCAAILVFVDVLKELPATLILRPFNFDTLAVRVYQLASDERLAEASTGALAIIVVGLIPIAILATLLDRPRTSESND